MDFEKIKKIKKKLLTQNASMCISLKIKNLFWPSSIKKNMQKVSLVVEVDNAKMANLLIKENLVLDYSFHGCRKYNPTCKLKQCFKC